MAATAMAAQKEEPSPPNGVAHKGEMEEAQQPPTPSEADKAKEENAAWSVEGIGSEEWAQAQELSDVLCENVARRRYYDELEADSKATRGYDCRVDIYWPEAPGMKHPMPFRDALGWAYGWCVEVFHGAHGEPDELQEVKRASNCIWQLVNLFHLLAKLRWKHHAFVGFQWLLDMLIRPNVGMWAVVKDWVRSKGEERQARTRAVKDAVDRVLTQWIGHVREMANHLYIMDGTARGQVNALIDYATFRIFRPEEDKLQFLGDLPKIIMDREWDVKLLTRIMVEMRSAWSEPRFLRLRHLLFTEPNHPEVKAGRNGIFKRHYDILQKVSLEAGPGGVRELCKHLSSAAPSDKTLQKVVMDIVCLVDGHGTAQWLPVAREEVFAPGRRVWAFYDMYMHTEQWRYRYIHVQDNAPNKFPLLGLSAGWLEGTVVGRPEDSAEALDGFVKVRVRFDGNFCDSRLLMQDVNVKATGKTEFPPNSGGHYLGRSHSRNKEFKIPITLVRDIGDPPPEALLAVLNVRPMDYFSNAKYSDYNICNDGYVQDIFHGPCSMRENIPGEYLVITAFIKETENLEGLDPEGLRPYLHARNVIGWYLQWPQIQSKSLWGNGSVRKQQFFNFCIRAERAKIRTGWPHESAVYELLAGKIWIPRMSLSRDFKVMPSCYMDYADFKRNPTRAARRALEHILHLQRVVWGKEAIPIESLKGVVKFGYSWCGTDVLPFIGPEGLIKVCDAMFAKEGNEQTTIMVQEMLPGVVAEYRNVCFFDKLTGTYHKERLWVAQMQKLKDPVEGFTGMASSLVVPNEIVAKNILGGDFEMLRAAESEAEMLVDRWLRWLRTETTTPVQCTRIDFLVAKGDKGKAKVWTCEVGECGGSLCSLEVHARNTAALNNAVRDDPSGRFPMPLHRPVMRTDGMKSH